MLSIRRSITFLSLVCLLTLCGFAGAQERLHSEEKWKYWVGERVHVQYDCCGEGTYQFIRDAELKEVVDKWIIVIVNKAPFLIPRYMIRSVILSK
jgi:hypothetical protein